MVVCMLAAQVPGLGGMGGQRASRGKWPESRGKRLVWLALQAALLVVVLLARHLSAAEGDARESRGPALEGLIQVVAVQTADQEAFTFSYDRLRLLIGDKLNPYVSYRVHLDFARQAALVDKDGDTPGIIKDAEVLLHLGRSITVVVGKTKAPVGMEFAVPGFALDFAKRGLGQALVFERNAGALLRWRPRGGQLRPAGDIGVFNAGPSNATDIGDQDTGPDYTLAGRLSLDRADNLHLEASLGAALTQVAGQEDVVFAGVGARYRPARCLHLKAEFMARDDGNNPAADGTDFYVQAGYRVRPRWEPLVKYERLDVGQGGANRRDVTVGINFMTNPSQPLQGLVRVNQVLSSATGKGATQVMFQALF